MCVLRGRSTAAPTYKYRYLLRQNFSNAKLEYLVFLKMNLKNFPRSKTSHSTKLSPFSSDFNYFVACAEAGNLRKAADRLDVQQAGLTKIIQRIEHQTGQILFFRGPRGVTLTDFGKALYDSLKSTQAHWNQVSSAEFDPTDTPNGTLTLGLHPSVACNEIPQILENLNKEFPRVKLELIFATSLQVTEMVAKHELDLGLVVNSIRHSDLIVKKIRKEFLAVWYKKRTSNTHVLFNPDMLDSARVTKLFPQAQLIEIKDYEVIAATIKQTDFLGLLPSSVAQRHGLYQCGKAIKEVDLALIWHRQRFLRQSKSKVAEAIIKSIEEKK